MIPYLEIKTFADWERTKLPLDQYLQYGNFVDQAMIDWAISTVPPAVQRSTFVQIGEPVDCVRDRDTFTTFIKVGNDWQYRGACWLNQIIQP